MGRTNRWLNYGTALAEFGMAVWLIVRGQYASALAFASAGVVFALTPGLVKGAYSRGWLAGRGAMFGSLGEAQRRGLSFLDWLRSEAERDGFGLHITTHNNEEGTS